MVKCVHEVVYRSWEISDQIYSFTGDSLPSTELLGSTNCFA